MEEVVYFISVKLRNIINNKTGERRRDIKATPYVRMESLTPDSETPETPVKTIKRPARAIGMTPRARGLRGVDLPRGRRINFDLVEDEDDDKNGS